MDDQAPVDQTEEVKVSTPKVIAIQSHDPSVQTTAALAETPVIEPHKPSNWEPRSTRIPVVDFLYCKTEPDEAEGSWKVTVGFDNKVDCDKFHREIENNLVVLAGVPELDEDGKVKRDVHGHLKFAHHRRVMRDPITHELLFHPVTKQPITIEPPAVVEPVVADPVVDPVVGTDPKLNADGTPKV